MKYAIAGLLAFGALFGASVQAAPSTPAVVATQTASSDAVQKVQYYGGPWGPWGYHRWGYRRWGYYGPGPWGLRPWLYRYGYYRPYYRPWGYPVRHW